MEKARGEMLRLQRSHLVCSNIICEKYNTRREFNWISDEEKLKL